MLFLKQSTAAVVNFGPAVDAADGATLEVGLVSALDHAATGIMLSKGGGVQAVRHAAVTASEYDANGLYLVTLDTTDTNTLGRLRAMFTDAACLPIWEDFEVLPANVYDSFFSTDKLQVDAVEISGDSTAADNLETAADGGAFNLGGGAVVAASVTGAVGSVTGAVGSVTGNVTGSVGSLAAQAKADVNAEVVDVLNVDTFAEIGQETPAATQTIRKMLGYLYKLFRNKSTQTATAFNLFNDDGTTVGQKSTDGDDGTTFTRGEISTGP